MASARVGPDAPGAAEHGLTLASTTQPIIAGSERLPARLLRSAVHVSVVVTSHTEYLVCAQPQRGGSSALRRCRRGPPAAAEDWLPANPCERGDRAADCATP